MAAAATLDGLFRERVQRTPDLVAYKAYNEQHGNWRDYTWAQIDRQVARWQSALEADGLKPGDRVAVMLRNSPEWVIFDQAALGLGLVVVPLYTQDRPENSAYIINNSDCKVLLVEGQEHWQALQDVLGELRGVVRFLTVSALPASGSDPRLKWIGDWLPEDGGATRHLARDGNSLATIVYTSGTTGRPKGVMLSHNNILSNTEAALTVLATGHDDIFMSFLPLSHTFERTCGYYLTIMSGSTVAYARSIPLLGEDLQTIRPTMLISVPRIYERIWSAIRAKLDEGSPLRKKLFLFAADVGYARFEHAQGRGPRRLSFLLWPLLNRLVASKVLARLGGRLRYALSGGAALPPDISRIFIGLGLPILQGYGLTETSPIATANRPENNIPASVGQPIPDVQIKIGDKGAVMIKGPNIMLGYWNNEEATRAMIGTDGWLNSGDTGRIGDQGHLFITGRLKEIIVLSNGEKVPPYDMEAAIAQDALFEQVILLGEGKSYLTVMAVLNPDHWKKLAADSGIDAGAAGALQSEPAEKAILARISAQIREFPGYAQVRRATVTLEPWTVENGLLTPTMKLKRAKVMEKFNAEIDQMYAGH
ncbi:MAG: long-chain fatty acid--CoA ligase [Betaproteobacteria bacterium]|nr:long-chain fatty acid--CoA ligase [Betaproteobacteria bacterium]MDH4293787.1 long-chain fatty acid--CoA ligase [Betaproteobacteria bacterium]MDH5343197.1 long-chain fatty acid--CoA ligase [Betaproteobacteria bacterium]